MFYYILLIGSLCPTGTVSPNTNAAVFINVKVKVKPQHVNAGTQDR